MAATNLQTGRVEYFEKGSCDLYLAAQASATVPFVSQPVQIDGVPYLDGGCAEKIPLGWPGVAEAKRLVVVRTRELSFRRKPGLPKPARRVYRRYPQFVEAMAGVNARFNRTVEELEQRAAAGELFLIAPSEPVTVTRFDGDMEKLGALYWLGFHDMEARMEELRRYLSR